jgi:hypothetical protein
MKRLKGRIKRALHASQLVVHIPQTINGNTQRLQTRISRRSDAVFRQIQPARLHRAVHSLFPHFADDLKPIASQIRLAANQGDFTRSHARELAHEIEAFLCRQLV